MIYEGKKLWIAKGEIRWVGSSYQWVIGIYQIALWKMSRLADPYFDIWLKNRG